MNVPPVIRNKSRSGISQGMKEPYKVMHKFEALPS